MNNPVNPKTVEVNNPISTLVVVTLLIIIPALPLGNYTASVMIVGSIIGLIILSLSVKSPDPVQRLIHFRNLLLLFSIAAGIAVTFVFFL